MATTKKNDMHGIFVVMNSAEVDLAALGAVASVDQAIDVEMLDGVDQNPLDSDSDTVLQVVLPVTIEAGLAVQTAVVTDSNTITVRFTNASAGSINAAAIAAGGIKFVVGRR